MDPLAISMAIMAVLQATNDIISICHHYRAAVKGAPWALDLVTTEVRGLRSVVESLEHLAFPLNDAESQLPRLRLLCEPRNGTGEPGLLDMCLVELTKLTKKLTPPTWAERAGPRVMALTQALKWPLHESDTTKTLETIGRFRGLLNLALNADQT